MSEQDGHAGVAAPGAGRPPSPPRAGDTRTVPLPGAARAPLVFVRGEGPVDAAGATATEALTGAPRAGAPGADALTVHAALDLGQDLDAPPLRPEPAPFRVLREVGRGGMGVVFAAEQLSLGREIALKALLSGDGDVHEAERRFVDEARITARLDHPNVIAVHDLGRDASGRPFIAMKLVRGTSWKDLIHPRAPERAASSEDDDLAAPPPLPPAPRAPRLSLRDHLDILLKVCDAVGCAHAHGIIHRDLKPANVMVGAHGEVLVMDWGIALELWRGEPWGAPAAAAGAGAQANPPPADRAPPVGAAPVAPGAPVALAAAASHAPTADPELWLAPVGTPRYMAPELAEGDPARMGPSTDVYLLGAILYELLTGTPPHPGTTRTEVVLAAARGEVEPPAARAPGCEVPAGLAAIAMRALEVDPARRYPSASAFAAAIRADLQNEASQRLVDLALAALAPLEARALAGPEDRAEPRGSGARARSALASAYAALAAAEAELREAAKLWPENERARDGLARAHLVHAALALRHGDLTTAELQLALVPAGAPGLEPARARLDALRAARARAEGRRRRALGLAIAALVVAVTAGGALYRREVERRRGADRARELSEAARLRREEAMALAENVTFTNFENRLALYARAVEVDPSWVEGWIELAWAHLARAYYERAPLDPALARPDLDATVPPLDRGIAAARTPQDALQALADRSYMFEARGEPERSHEDARALADLAPDSVQGLGARAQLAFVAGGFEEAERLWTRQLELGPSVEENTRLWRAHTRFIRGAFADARADLAASLVDWPTDESYLSVVALCHLAEGDPRAAAFALLRAYEVRERAPHLAAVVACLAGLRGDSEEAEALFALARREREAYAACFYYPTFWSALARTRSPHDRLGRVAALEAPPSTLYPPAPPEGLRLRRRGEEREAAGDAEGALADATRALAENPADGRARLLRARALIRLGHEREAREDLRLVPLLAPTRAAEARALLDGIDRPR